jgi:hypothetical protein
MTIDDIQLEEEIELIKLLLEIPINVKGITENASPSGPKIPLDNWIVSFYLERWEQLKQPMPSFLTLGPNIGIPTDGLIE